MKYIARPVEVEAHKILEVIELDGGVFGKPEIALRLDSNIGDGWQFRPTPEMMSRMTPIIGDYVVVQADGYIYLNPKDVFERKYRPANA